MDIFIKWNSNRLAVALRVFSCVSVVGRSAGARGVWSDSAPSRCSPSRLARSPIAAATPIVSDVVVRLAGLLHRVIRETLLNGRAVLSSRYRVRRIRVRPRKNVQWENLSVAVARCAPHCVTTRICVYESLDREGRTIRKRKGESARGSEPKGVREWRRSRERVPRRRKERRKDYIFGQHGYRDRRPAGAVGAISSGESLRSQRLYQNYHISTLVSEVTGFSASRQ